MQLVKALSFLLAVLVPGLGALQRGLGPWDPLLHFLGAVSSSKKMVGDDVNPRKSIFGT